MCRRHWYQVPKKLRDAVWITWQSGNGVGTPEHTDAVLAAIAAASDSHYTDDSSRPASEGLALRQFRA